MSECSNFVSGSPNSPALPGTLGRPQPGRRVALFENGVLGIATTDPGLMLGYWNVEKGGPIPVDGEWFSTGDMMDLVGDESLTYLGRDDDMMNAGGFRVSPLEVESVFNTHPDIQDCAAVEEQISEDTKLIALHYVSPEPLPNEVLETFCASQLARYKQPRIFHHKTDLPRGANGKLLRKALR